MTRLATRAVAAVALTPGLAAPLALFTGGGALQAAPPVGVRVSAVTDLAHESWAAIKGHLENQRNLNEIPHIDSLWNNIQAVFHVSDEAGIASIDQIRLEIIARGATNPAIPARIVHGALYTLSVSGRHLSLERSRVQVAMNELAATIADLGSQEMLLAKLQMPLPSEKQQEKESLIKKLAALGERKAEIDKQKTEMARAAVPYLGRIIVDAQTKHGKLQRRLLPEREVSTLRDQFVVIEPYRASDFEKLGSFVIGQVASRETLEQVAQELLSVGNEVDRRDALLEVLLNLPPGTAVPRALLEQSTVWVFGRDQLRNEKKATVDIILPPAPPNQIGPALPIPGAMLVAASSARIGEPTPPEIPGVPPGTRTGSLDVLKQIDPSLVSARMTFPFGRDAAHQEFIARNIAFLAQHNVPSALVAASQWFAQRHYEVGLRPSTEADHTVLRALIACAQRDPRGFEVLARVGASYPDLLLLDILLIGALDSQPTEAREASTELRKLLSDHKELGVNWLQSCLNGEAGLIWPEPAGVEESKVVNAIREQCSALAIRVMAVSGLNMRFVEDFRAIASNPFQQPRQLSAAIAGLALAKDRASVDLLLSRAMNETLHPDLRELALQAVLMVDAPDLLPPAIAAKGSHQDPFAPIFLGHAAKDGSHKVSEKEQFALDQLIDSEYFNPFKERLCFRVEEWLNKQNAARALITAAGGEPSAVTEAEKLEMMVKMWRQQWGSPAFAGVCESPSPVPIKAEHLDAMIAYLRQGKEGDSALDLSLAAPMMMILSKTSHPGARQLLADIATYPERYAVDESKEGFFGILHNYMGTAFLKTTALDSIGGMLDLATLDDAATVVHRVVRKSSVALFREAALVSLRVLADRYEHARLSDISAEERARHEQVRAAHAQECLGHLAYHRQFLESAGQPRLAQMRTEFELVKLADRFGATRELLLLVDEACGGNVQGVIQGKDLRTEGDRRPLFVRSVIHALISNGRKVEDLGGLGLDPEVTKRVETLFSFVANQDYWLGPASERRYTGKGTEVAVFDVGYILPLGITESMNDQIVYPEHLVDWGRVAHQQELHPTMVAWTLYQAAHDAKIRTYDVNARAQEIRFRPEEIQHPIFRAFEDLAEQQLTGKANVDVANYSFGLPNALLVDQKIRAEFIDQMSAFMEILSRMEVKHAVAAANGHGEGGFLPIGEVNSLGLRFVKRPTAVSKPDSVFIAAAHDAFTGRLAEFSSKQDELRTESGVRLRSFHGVNSMVPDYEDGMPVLSPVNGTSFGSPNQAAMLLWGVEAAREGGIAPLTHRQWQEIFDKSIRPLPGRESWEGGDLFHVPLFLEQLRIMTGQK